MGEALHLKNTLFKLVKTLVSITSLFLALHAVDFSGLASNLTSVHLGFVAAALIIFWAAQIVSSLRYVYIAQELGGNLQLSTCIKAHFIGLWFNQVLPTGLGGDVLKIAVLKKVVGLGIAARCTILDRFSGLFLLMLAILFTLPLYSNVIPIEQTALLAGLKILPMGFIFATVMGAWGATRIYKYVAPMPVLSHFFSLISDVWLFRKGRSLWRQLWTSTIIHLNGIAAFAFLGLALGLKVEPLVFVLIVPLIFLIGLVPISFAGWGVRELGAIWLFGLVGFPKENALLLSVAYGLMLIIAGLPGLYFFNADQARATQGEIKG